ncbi:MAG: efflux RND transporter periplasmic adaptor subunit, partial [Syntrophobacteraceae bacterium]
VYKIDANTNPNTRTFPAYIELPNQHQSLRLGLTGYTVMMHRVQALAVPSVAVIDLFDKPMVFVVKDKKAWIRHIAPGGIASGYTWIRQGLGAGDQVVIAGQRYLKEAEPVNVMQKLYPELPARLQPAAEKN